MQNYPQNYAFEGSWKMETITYDSHFPLVQVLPRWECLPWGIILRIKEVCDRKKDIPSATEVACSQVTPVKVALTVMTGVKYCPENMRWGIGGVCCNVLSPLCGFPRTSWEREIFQEWPYMSKQMRITLELGVLLFKWHYLYFKAA